MGMYTEINCAFSLKKDTPEDVINILEYMMGGANIPPKTPDHYLFRDDNRWPIMLSCDSYYFDGDQSSSVRYDDIGEQHYVTIRSNLKNYDGEIRAFINWITPYMDMLDGDFIGYSRYEEDEWPELIHYPNTFTDTSKLNPEKEKEIKMTSNEDRNIRDLLKGFQIVGAFTDTTYIWKGENVQRLTKCLLELIDRVETTEEKLKKLEKTND